MRCDHVVEGHALRLRPVTDDDAAFIVALRTNPALAGFIHITSPSVDAQRAWLAAWRRRSGDHYFAIEPLRGGAPEGLIALYDIDATTREGEWGRWILRPHSLAAVESAWLIYRFAFETLGLAAIACRTVAANRAVVSFHDSCGSEERRLLPAHVELHGQRHDMIEHRHIAAGWPALSARLEPLARLTARRLQREPV